MSFETRTHPRRRTYVAALATAVVAAAATSCGGGTGGGRQGSSAAADFVRQVTTQFSRGQAGPLWDELHPADQTVVTRARYMACQSNSGFDLTKLAVLETYPDRIDIAGKTTPATAVSVRVTSEDGITTATMHAVQLKGTWRWVLSQADYAAYKHGKCPAS